MLNLNSAIPPDFFVAMRSSGLDFAHKLEKQNTFIRNVFGCHFRGEHCEVTRWADGDVNKTVWAGLIHWSTFVFQVDFTYESMREDFNTEITRDA